MAVTFPSQPSSLSAPKAQLHRQHAQECPVWHRGWEVPAAPSSGAERFKTGSPVIILLQLTRGWKVEQGIRGKGGNYRGATGRQGWELGGEIAPAADGSQHPNKNQQVTPWNVPSQSFTEDSMLHPKGKSAPTGFIYSQIKKYPSDGERLSALQSVGRLWGDEQDGPHEVTDPPHGLWSFHGAGQDNARSRLHPTMASMWI